MGRWSLELAREFVSWLQIPDGQHWLDLGCGTGALTNAICAHAKPASVAACDPVSAFIEYARASCDDERVSFVVAGADDFPMRAGGYDSLATLLALNFFPNRESALRRLCSAAGANGTIAACVWDYAGEMQFLRYFWDVAAQTNPAAHQYDEGVRFSICAPDKLKDLFSAAGLLDVRCEPIEIATEFQSFEDYWRPLLGGTGPAPSYVASLDSHERSLVRDRLEATLPVSRDGRIALRARAWAVRGRMPQAVG